jgi:hypothetical protein
MFQRPCLLYSCHPRTFSHFCVPLVSKREGGYPDQGLHRPRARAKLSPGFPIETFGNDRVLLCFPCLSSPHILSGDPAVNCVGHVPAWSLVLDSRLNRSGTTRSRVSLRAFSAKQSILRCTDCFVVPKRNCGTPRNDWVPFFVCHPLMSVSIR